MGRLFGLQFCTNVKKNMKRKYSNNFFNKKKFSRFPKKIILQTFPYWYQKKFKRIETFLEQLVMILCEIPFGFHL